MRRLSVSGSNKGLTLVELLVAMTVFLAVIAISLSVLYNTQRVQRQLDKKYKLKGEINRVMKKVEKSVMQTEKLISGGNHSIAFTGPAGDTIKYYIRNDTLFENNKPLTTLAVDLLNFTYIKPIDNRKISDFFSLDSNMNGVLDYNETRAISGIEIDLQFVYMEKSVEHRVKKHLVILLRNFQILRENIN